MSTNDDIYYVCSFDQIVVSRIDHDAIAISCYLHGQAANGAIGFSINQHTEDVRRQLISNGVCFDGCEFLPTDKGNDVYFAPSPRSANFLAKLVSKPMLDMQAGAECPEPPEELLKGIQELGARFLDSARNERLLQELAGLHSRHGWLMLYWPYFTPYESICYMAGAGRGELLQQVLEFFLVRDLKIRQLDDLHFPIY